MRPKSDNPEILLEHGKKLLFTMILGIFGAQM
jgi:hypothetical protein